MDSLDFDFESSSEKDLTKVGLDNYSAHPSTQILMCSYGFNGEPLRLWQREDGRFPNFLREAIADPHVRKNAFNAQFERVMSRRVLKIKTPYRNWRCTMALAYSVSFTGDLGEVGKQIGLPVEKQKIADGKRLIKKFSMPQKVTKNQPFRWRDELTDPADWDLFGTYCIGDTETERAVRRRLEKYPIDDFEWELYELDQRINDRGLPIDRLLCENAIIMADRRRIELTDMLRDITHLANPNSPAQLLDWLQERGYPFADLQKETVKKVLKGADDWEFNITSEAVKTLKLRQQVARTSVKKYNKFMDLMSPDDVIRFQYQFGGASRTKRWAGRGIQPHNLPRTPKAIEPEGGDVSKLAITNQAIRDGDYELLGLIMAEPMDALSGCVRSAITAPEGSELRVADLSSIETVVIGWLSGCERLLNVFRDGRDAYKDFATLLYKIVYEEVTKEQRTKCKPATLGCGFRLGGGKIDDKGKRTGLWGYAEAMGVELTQEEAALAVKVFRESYREIVDLWYDLEDAVRECVQTGREQTVGPLTFNLLKPFMTVRLPSGRLMYYYKPRIEIEQYPKTDKEGNKLYDEDGNQKYYKKQVFTYEGREQGSHTWGRIKSHGGKLVENFVQAIARDILAIGMMRAHKAGFYLVGSVHDELKSLAAILNKVHTVERLIECMTEEIPWCADMPLKAAGWANRFYFKD